MNFLDISPLASTSDQLESLYCQCTVSLGTLDRCTLSVHNRKISLISSPGWTVYCIPTSTFMGRRAPKVSGSAREIPMLKGQWLEAKESSYCLPGWVSFYWTLFIVIYSHCALIIWVLLKGKVQNSYQLILDTLVKSKLSNMQKSKCAVQFKDPCVRSCEPVLFRPVFAPFWYVISIIYLLNCWYLLSTVRILIQCARYLCWFML